MVSPPPFAKLLTNIVTIFKPIIEIKTILDLGIIQVAVKSGGQKWTPKVAVKKGPQKWRPKVAAKSGGQKWTPKVAVKSGPQKWRPKVDPKSGGQKWTPPCRWQLILQKRKWEEEDILLTPSPYKIHYLPKLTLHRQLQPFRRGAVSNIFKDEITYFLN